MYEYEMSEKLFLDIWEKYECPEEVSDPLTIYNILNDIIVKSKHWIVLDHYSHINCTELHMQLFFFPIHLIHQQALE